MIQTTLGQISASSYGKIPLGLLQEFFAEDIKWTWGKINISNTARLAEFLAKYPEHTEAMLDAVIDIASDVPN